MYVMTIAMPLRELTMPAGQLGYLVQVVAPLNAPIVTSAQPARCRSIVIDIARE